MVDSFTQMAITSKDNLKMVLLMEKEHMFKETQLTKDSLRTMFSMERVLNQMNSINLKGSLSKEIKRKANSALKNKNTSMWVSSNTINTMVMEFWLDKMKNTKELFKKVLKVGMENWSRFRNTPMKDSSSTMKSMVKGSSSILLVS